MTVDLAMRGFVISFSTPASVELSNSFLSFLIDMSEHDVETKAIQSHFAQLRGM